MILRIFQIRLPLHPSADFTYPSLHVQKYDPSVFPHFVFFSLQTSGEAHSSISTNMQSVFHYSIESSSQSTLSSQVRKSVKTHYPGEVLRLFYTLVKFLPQTSFSDSFYTSHGDYLSIFSLPIRGVIVRKFMTQQPNKIF